MKPLVLTHCGSAREAGGFEGAFGGFAGAEVVAGGGNDAPVGARGRGGLDTGVEVAELGGDIGRRPLRDARAGACAGLESLEIAFSGHISGF
jgi:hypothetical protein